MCETNQRRIKLNPLKIISSNNFSSRKIFRRRKKKRKKKKYASRIIMKSFPSEIDETRKLFLVQTSRERKKRKRKKKRKGKKKKKGRKNTTFLRRRGFSSRRVNDQPVVETNNDIMVIQGSTFSSSWRIPSLSAVP